ncbi:MAG: hypothetical protein IKB72_00175 [Ruminococcus sp.]|nr:hypothetical protein [Ruminococcus sp.]
MNSTTPTPKKKTIEKFFGKIYIVIFAVIMFAGAAVKLAFTLSQTSATNIWKFILIFDTITTLLTAASLFLFYMSSDTKTKTGTKISAVTFLVASALTVFTQFFVFLYYMSVSFSVVIAMLTLLFFGAQSLFMLYFAIRLTIDVFKGQISAKGALAYAGAKAFSIIPMLIIRFVKSELLALDHFHTPFENATVTRVDYPEIAFYLAIASALVMTIFALLYNKFANDCKEESEETTTEDK